MNEHEWAVYRMCFRERLPDLVLYIGYFALLIGVILFPYMTALENVLLAVFIAKNIEGKEVRKKAVELLRKLGIDDETMSRPITQISGGQQQRTAIARALIKTRLRNCIHKRLSRV